MSIDEKLEFIEKILHEPKFSLQEATELNSLNGWESLNIVNLEMELIAKGVSINEEYLKSCKTVGEICRLF